MGKSRNKNGYYVPKIEMRFSGYDSIVHNRFVLSGTIWIQDHIRDQFISSYQFVRKYLCFAWYSLLSYHLKH